MRCPRKYNHLASSIPIPKKDKEILKSKFGIEVWQINSIDKRYKSLFEERPSTHRVFKYTLTHLLIKLKNLIKKWKTKKN